MRLSALAIILSVCCVSASAEEPPALSPASMKVLADIDARSGMIADLSSKIWGWAEVGYKEEQSSKLLADTLETEGFALKRGVAGIPTAFTAEWGSGGPVIGVLAEFDALPGINQDASATRAPIDGKAAGHACGHNLFGAGSVGAAIAIKNWLAETKAPGTIRLYGTPAEEGGSGKVYMVREGLFKDVDVVLHWHADDKNAADGETSLSNRRRNSASRAFPRMPPARPIAGARRSTASKR